MLAIPGNVLRRSADVNVEQLTCRSTRQYSQTEPALIDAACVAALLDIIYEHITCWCHSTGLSTASMKSSIGRAVWLLAV